MHRLVYVLSIVVLAGCSAGRGPELVPATATTVPAAELRDWVRPDALPGRTLMRFRWAYKNDKAGAGGRGSVRLASPDSLRLDTAGPLGSKAASAFVVGDTALWVEPADAVDRLIPNYPLMWAMFGMARLPAAGARVEGVRDSIATSWRYVMGADTLAYRRTALVLQSEYRSGGKLVGRSVSTFAPDGALLKARLTVPSVPAQLDITILRILKNEAFDADVWKRRAPDSASVDR